jgi:lysozyme family protein
MSVTGWISGIFNKPSPAAPTSAPAPAAVAAPDRFTECLPFILEHEGGFVNNPNDPGGATNKGITLLTARAAFGASFSVAQLKALTAEQAGAIYRKNYWLAAGCDKMPAGVDLSVFDTAVMSGPHAALAMVQRGAKLKDDGVFGPLTLAACVANPNAMIDEIAAQRVVFYRDIVARTASSAEFLTGWLNRVELTRKQAQDMLRAVMVVHPDASV